MSTKATIAHDDNYHLYDELMDGGIYLEVRNAENASFEVTNGHTYVHVRLPKELIKRLKLDDKQLVESGAMFDDDVAINAVNK